MKDTNELKVRLQSFRVSTNEQNELTKLLKQVNVKNKSRYYLDAILEKIERDAKEKNIKLDSKLIGNKLI
ncbi:MAG: hypothetical protein ACQESP_12720 [Candidatus Muiribacteriota bacterium]